MVLAPLVLPALTILSIAISCPRSDVGYRSSPRLGVLPAALPVSTRSHLSRVAVVFAIARRLRVLQLAQIRSASVLARGGELGDRPVCAYPTAEYRGTGAVPPRIPRAADANPAAR